MFHEALVPFAERWIISMKISNGFGPFIIYDEDMLEIILDMFGLNHGGGSYLA